MNKYYLHLVIVFCLFFSASNAQNKIKENAPFQKTFKFTNDVSKENAIAVFLKKNKLDSENTFISKKETSDESGLIHQRHQQYYKGIKVEFGTLITHSLDGNVKSINAELYNAETLSVVPALDPQSGFQKALNNIDAQKYLWEDPQQAAIVGYEKPVGELIIFPMVKTGEVKLAYKYDIYSIEPIARLEVYVDAQTGQILYKNPIIKHADRLTSKVETTADSNTIEALVTGNAATKYSGSRNIETIFDAGLNKYVLSDITRGNGVVTYNCERIVNSYQNVHFADNDNNWTIAEHANSFQDNAALDAHWGAEMTYDFWKNIFNRNSFDDNNAVIKSYVHFQKTAASLSNAFWNGSFMTYGDGSPKAFTSIDICGHEIGHAICSNTANLAYQNQSGAINEGFSDIWGACIEHYGRTGSFTGTPVANVWKIGEDIVTGALRSMSTPLSKGDPDTFQGTNWFVTADDGPCSPASGNDYCGVHTNSGVMNHWFYILTAGKSGTNNAPIADRDTYNVSGIGIIKSSQIAYFAERDYLTPNATYFDVRIATIEVANNLYCAVSPEVIAVTNAWFAVNVGPSFVSYTNDLALKDIPHSSSFACGTTTYSPTILFKNQGANTVTSVNISYNIDGGTNTNSVWNGNLPTCSTGSQQLVINTASLSIGTHVLNVTTTIPGDGNIFNNTRTSLFFVNSSTNTNQVNTFESSSDDLISYNESGSTSIWERGTSGKSVLTNTVAGNSKVYATKLVDFYPANIKSYLVSKCYDLTQISNPMLKFDMAFDIESNYDVLYMQYSINGGNTWSLLGTASDPNWYTSNFDCANCVGGEWSGEADITNISGTTNGTKRQYSYSLASFGAGSASPQSNMIFRYVFQSDEETEYDGAIIDNFVIEGTLSADEAVFNNLKIYPNPTSNEINISFSSETNEPVNVSMIDVQGRLIMKLTLDSMAGGNINQSINVASIPSGFYMLKITQGNLKYNTKIIKK